MVKSGKNNDTVPLPIMLDNSCSEILDSFPLQSISSFCLFLVLHMWTALFTTDRRFLRFESRDWDSHHKTLILCSHNHLFAYLDVWLLLLSCWNIHVWPSVNLLQWWDVFSGCSMEMWCLLWLNVGLALYCHWAVNMSALSSETTCLYIFYSSVHSHVCLSAKHCV